MVWSREGRTLREIIFFPAFLLFFEDAVYSIVSALTDASIYSVRSVDGIWFVWIFQVVPSCALLSVVER